MTDCGGETRFAASAAKRLSSLGALLKGDRRALGAGVELKEFDVDNRDGQAALERVYKDIIGETTGPMINVEVPELPERLKPTRGQAADTPECLKYRGPRENEHFYAAMRSSCLKVDLLECSDRNGYSIPKGQEKKVPRFLNRMLGLPIDEQALLFAYFSSTLDAVITQAKASGAFDDGIVTIKGMTSVTLEHEEVIHTDAASGAKTYHLSLIADRGLPWEAAKAYRDKANQLIKEGRRQPSGHAGFYVDKYGPARGQGQSGHPNILLATDLVKQSAAARFNRFRIQKPWNVTNASLKQHDLRDLWKPVSDAVAQKHWEFWHSHLLTGCIHAKACSRRRSGQACTVGSRLSEVELISGAVLPVMAPLFNSIRYASGGDKEGRPRVTRTILNKCNGLRVDGCKVVGVSLSRSAVEQFKESLMGAAHRKPVHESGY